MRPATTSTLDYEAELAVVIGRAGRHIAVRDAPAYIGGYTIGSDMTAFDLMFPGHAQNPDAMPARSCSSCAARATTPSCRWARPS